MSEDNIFSTIRVEGEILFNKDKVKLLELFKSQGFDDQQSDELANAMKRAVYYLRKDRVERKKIEKATMKELRGDWKKKIGITKTLLEKENIEFLNERSSDKKLTYNIFIEFAVAHLRLETAPRAGHNLFFRLALAPLFWKLKKWEYGQAKQVDIVYDLFVEYKLDDYGTVFEDGKTYIGEKEQKERIRKGFQQPAFRYWEEFPQKFGFI